MNSEDMPNLPQRVVVQVDFGSGPQHPAIRYTAPADVIERFAVALRQWNPDYRIDVEDVQPDAEDLPPDFPMCRLFAWDEPTNRATS